MPNRRIKYETDAGNIFFVVCDDDSSIDTVLGTPPTGNETENMTMRISKNKNEAGASPRYILMARLVGTDDDNAQGLYQGGRQYKEIPVTTKNHFGTINTGKVGDSAATQITHRGETYYAVRKISEKFV